MTFEEEVAFFLSASQVLIAPYYFDGAQSIIHVEDGYMLSKGSVKEIIKAICIKFGATLEGRLEASRKLLNITKNPPVIISERLGIVGMQVPCFKYKEPAWVFNFDYKIDPYPSYSELIFNKNLKFKVDLSKNSIRDRQNNTFNLLFRIWPLNA